MKVYRDDIFPVPPLNLHAKSYRKLSRGCQQRLGRYLHRQDRINDCIAGLNWMAGKPWEGEPAGRVHAEVQSYVAQCVDECFVPTELPSPDEASSVLLRVKAGYYSDPGRCATATFKADILSLPSSIQGAPPSPMSWVQ